MHSSEKVTGPSNRNMSTQHIETSWAQHVARLWPGTLLRHVATYWVLLAQVKRWSKFSCNISGCGTTLHSFGLVCTTMLPLGLCNRFDFQPALNVSQHVATAWPNARKNLAPNSVAICRVEMSQSFGQSLSYPPRYL